MEKTEKAKNSQLAREIEVALPRELTLSENKELIKEYVKKTFVDCGMCADIAIHDKYDGNPHAHIMLTMRSFNEDKTWGDKQKKKYILDQNGEKIYDPKKRQYKCDKIQTTDWNERHKAEEWRAAWADITNRWLKEPTYENRVDHRSYERQGINQIPTILLGPAAHQMERCGIKTERGNINRTIEISNRKLRRIEERINELQGWLKEEMEKTETPMPAPQSPKFGVSIPKPQTPKITSPKSFTPKMATQKQTETAPLKSQPPAPTFAGIIADILAHQGQVVVNSKTTAQILDFLKDKQIKDFNGLENYLKGLMSKQREISHKFKPLRERLDRLASYINQYETYLKNKAKYDKYLEDYNAQLPWKKKAFAENNKGIVENYNASKVFVEAMLNKEKRVPINAWKKEHEKLTAEIQKLNGEYKFLQNEVSQVDKIRVNVYDILRKDRQIGQPVKSRSMEL